MAHIINDNVDMDSKEKFDALINGLAGISKLAMPLSDLFVGCHSISDIDLSLFSDFTTVKQCEWQECVDGGTKICTSSNYCEHKSGLCSSGQICGKIYFLK